ncbi:DNA/RNA nuclease SfsA [Anaeromicropila populeti]|uniref:Sugar fermentation stimulation protein homolog n=1 Tax=Anaeromicropila populeti TaxID=37658 RepID=A0A1I6JHG7_9FIRM|nr:DNA/RNA nuclease SfsA [Anaeromicropila populeti]SFR78309.1 sugar fermentation stimulation protein A [Anaeromicropila populeti]
MRYENIITGIFIDRPNRFIAYVKIGDEVCQCHVKNTGRCKELLIPGKSKVYLEDHGANAKRKTRYSLVAVIKETEKENILINMDSQAPNKVAREWLESGGLEGNITYIKAEKTFEDSRFDLYFEYDDEKNQLCKAFMEVKGVTLEENGVVRFPDAPTQRGVKHLEGLMKAKKAGYVTYLLFVVQMGKFERFEPNGSTDPVFANTLRKAEEEGVIVIVKGCRITPDSLQIL